MPIKSFRGLLADQATETISLHTNNGSVGYRIKKFEILAQKPGNVHNESVVKIYSVPQTTPDAFIDFSDNTLLAVGYISTDASSTQSPEDIVIIFDNVKFNQDIYLTHVDVEVGESVNYYIELEQIKLDLNENTVATLKDIRNIASQ